MAAGAVLDIPDECRPYCPRGAALELLYAREHELLMVGAAGTGKSRAALEKAHLVAQKYAGCRILTCRKTRESMSQSTLVTWEAKVVQVGFFGDSNVARSHRQSYQYPNGSEVVVGGLDKPSKILSTEFDLIIVDEATEIDEESWETLLSRLRNHVVPYQQAIACCNPDAASHWLNQRALKGGMRRLTSVHKDNPSVTRDYLDMLDRLTGVRRLRLRDGVWAQAEGVVYEEYDPAVHVKKLDAEKSFFSNGFFASVDWGFTHAGVLQVWGMDHDGRMYLVYEVYRSGQTIDWWVEQAKRAGAAFGFNLFVCDSARPDHIDQMKKHGLNAIEAYKSVEVGIQAVKHRLAIAGDGKTRLYLLDDCLSGRDEKLVEAKRPWRTAHEFDAYVWDAAKDKPVKENDDGMDALRYAVAYADKLGGGHLIVK